MCQGHPVRFVTLCVVTVLAACSAADPTPSATSELSTSSCERAAVVHTAPAALADGTPLNINDVVAQGGTPLESGDRVVFVAQGPGSWRASGGFSGWDPNGGVELHPIAGTDLFIGSAIIPRGRSYEYKLVHDGRWVEDPLARNVRWDGIDRGFGVRGEMNAIVHPADLPRDAGRTVSFGKLEGRSVWVHYPATYDSASCAKLPSIVIHDGMESLTRGGFAEEADALYAERPDLSAILVFVDVTRPEERMAEYTVYSAGSRGDRYVSYLANTLWPAVNARACAAPAARGIAGASLGGLISTYAGLERPDTWGWIGSQSGSFFWADDAMIARASALPHEPVRVYLDSGCNADPESDNCGPTDQLASVLSSKGYDFVRIREDGGQHDWSYWRGRLRGMLTHFRADQPACD